MVGHRGPVAARGGLIFKNLAAENTKSAVKFLTRLLGLRPYSWVENKNQ
jgi:hypothetical protein